MKKALLFLLFIPFSALAQNGFNKYFIQESLRIDFILAGNYKNSNAFFHSLKREPFWGGSVINLVDTLEYGSHKFQIISAETGEIIFSRGFCTLFQEWQTTSEAQIVERSFCQSAVFPFPKAPVYFELFQRDDKLCFKKMASWKIDPDDFFIQPPFDEKYEIINVLKTGNPADKVDIVFLPEGYTQNEMPKFVDDVLRLSDSLFNTTPFREMKQSFNVYAVLAPSEESGSDIPGINVWRKTLLNSSYYTFNSERYLTTPDYWKVCDLASLVPYDQICILVNTPKYGGGGLYNHYSIIAADHRYSHLVFIHEFGHAFAGLADEYYDSEVAYDNYYPLDVEPWEPNITTLVNFTRKWEHLLQPGIPVPTPDTEYYRNVTGVFEGGGYSARGIYRPQVNCWMNNLHSGGFCTVCTGSIKKMIRWVTR